MTITLKAKKIFIYLSLAILTILVAKFVFWSLQPTNVLEIKNAPFPVKIIPNYPTPAGTVFMKVDYCKKVKATGRVRMSFVGVTKEVFLPLTEDKQDPTCKKTELPIPIPEDLSPGTYHVHFRVTYDINPIKQSVVNEFDSKEFKVGE